MTAVLGYYCTKGATGENAKPRHIVLGMEFGVRQLPVFIFLITGTLRLARIRSIARNKVIYSNVFKVKLLLSFLLGLLYFSYLPVNYFTSPDSHGSSWINQCDLDQWTWFYLIDAAAWFFCCYLLKFEYDRLLSEAWWSTKTFWTLSFLA
jgi:hypothetical protein